MTLPFDVVMNPEENGYEVCAHCNGYGSSLKEEARRCTRCDGHGVVPAEGEEAARRRAAAPSD
jgi:DnaJ-class molecular chaperone